MDQSTMAGCFLCGEDGADYITTVLIHDTRNLGQMTVEVHMECLLEKGGTYWSVADTPQLTPEVLAGLQELPYEEARQAYLEDARRFEADFPELAKELTKLQAMAEEARRRGLTVPCQGVCIWYGVLRLVDWLATLRRWWAEMKDRAGYLEYRQGQLL